MEHVSQSDFDCGVLQCVPETGLDRPTFKLEKFQVPADRAGDDTNTVASVRIPLRKLVGSGTPGLEF
jgi:hypothetical protein